MARFLTWMLVVLAVVGLGCSGSTASSPGGSADSGVDTSTGTHPTGKDGATATFTGGISGLITLGSVTSPPPFPVTASGPQSVAGTVTSTGAFSFSNLPAGTYVVTVSAPSTREATLATAVKVTTGVAVATTLAFTPLGTVTGVATLGSSTGNAGIMISAPGTSAVTLTDDAGNYTLPGVPSGSQTIIASFAGYAGGTAKATVPYNAPVTAPAITLTKGAFPGSITGSVALSNTAAQTGLVLTLSGPTSGVATTTAGAYSFTGLQAGAYTVTATVPSTLELIESVDVTVAAAAATAPALSFTAIGSFTGTVTLSGATDSSGILVSIPTLGLEAVTNSAGAFSLNGVPAGAQSLLASMAGFVSGTASATSVYNTATAVPAFVLSPAAVKPTTVTLQGQALLFDQTSSAGTTVKVIGSSPLLSATTAADGSYSIANVPVGVVGLSFSNTALAQPYNETLQGVTVGQGTTGTVVGPALTGGGTATYTLSQTPMFVPKGSRIDTGLTGLPTFTPDGTKALINIPSSLGGTNSELAPLNGSAPLVFSANATNTPNQYVFSSDGTELAYTSLASGGLYNIYSYPVAGGALTTLATGVASPQLRAAGSHVVWYNQIYNGSTYQLSIYSAPFSGGTPTTLFSGLSNGGFYNFLVTADGSHAVWGTYVSTGPAYTMYSVATAGGTPLTLATGPSYIYPQALSGDSRYVIYTNQASYPTSYYFAIPVAGGSAVSLAPGGTTSYGSIYTQTAAVSDYLVGTYYNGTIWSLYSSPLGGGAPVVIQSPIPSGYSYVPGLVASPDGSHVCFANYPTSPYPVYCAPLATGGAVGLGTSDLNINMVFSTNGAYLAWSRSGALLSAAVGGGTPETPVASGLNSAVALDGTHLMAFYESASGVGTLASVSLTGAAQAVLASNVSNFSLSPDHSRVAYTSYLNNWLYSVPTAGGTPTPIANFAYSNWFTWTAAANQLAYDEYQVPSPYNFQNGLYGIVTP